MTGDRLEVTWSHGVAVQSVDTSGVKDAADAARAADYAIVVVGDTAEGVGCVDTCLVCLACVRCCFSRHMRAHPNMCVCVCVCARAWARVASPPPTTGVPCT